MAKGDAVLWCIVHLFTFAFIGLFAASMFGPDLRGNDPSPFGALMLGAALVVGTSFAAPHVRKPWVFSIYGWLVSLPGVICLLPGTDHLRGMAMGRAALWFHVAMAVVYVVLTGVACRTAAMISMDRAPRPDREPWEFRCRQCGYLLTRLPLPRCPECGTSFRRTHACRAATQRAVAERA